MITLKGLLVLRRVLDANPNTFCSVSRATLLALLAAAEKRATAEPSFAFDPLCDCGSGWRCEVHPDVEPHVDRGHGIKVQIGNVTFPPVSPADSDPVELQVSADGETWESAAAAKERCDPKTLGELTAEVARRDALEKACVQAQADNPEAIIEIDHARGQLVARRRDEGTVVGIMLVEEPDRTVGIGIAYDTDEEES